MNLLAALLPIHAAIQAPAATPAPTPGLMAEIPFTHEPGRIWLKGTLNGTPVWSILDSGAAAIVVSEEAAARSGATKGAAFRSNTVGGPSDAWRASGLMFALEGSPLTISVSAIVSFARAESRSIDVAVGYGLFSVFGIGVDYVQSKVRIYSPGTFTPPTGMVALPLKFVDGAPVVTMTLRLPGGKSRKVDALVDTGSPLALEVTRRLAKRDGMDKRYRDLPEVDQPGGIGGPTKAKLVSGIEGELGGTTIGGTAIVNMTKEGSTGDESKYDVLVGDGILKHFDLTFDYLRKTLWIRPNGR